MEQANKQTAQKHILEHGRLSSLINSMADGVIAIDDAQKVAVYNGAALNILDINTAITGKNIASVFQLIKSDGQAINISQLMNQVNRPFASRDYLLRYADGSTINVYVSIAPVRLGYGQTGTGGHVILVRDITHEKSLEEERDEFISVVSHELRTPITIAEGNVSNALVAAEKGQDTTKMTDTLKLAHEQIVFLSNLINDLSTLSRAERGKMAVNVESINVHELMSEFQKSYTPEARQKGLSLHVEIDPQLELVNSSRMYVKEILQNFITNAIKYTQQGSVSIRAKRQQNGVQFLVADTGIGISRNDQAKIFEKFFRSEDYRTRETNGTGLGLYVTLKLAKMIHAEIAVNSELNKGSVFTITIPNLTK